MTIVYDSTFEGFLCVIHECYTQKLKPTAISRTHSHADLLSQTIEIPYEPSKATKVLDSLKTKFSHAAFETILNIFMCDSAEFEYDLLRYIIIGFRDQKRLGDINEPSVFRIMNLQKELFRYSHKMSGFLRFRELDDGTLYAQIEGKFNVLYFLGKHFSKRLNNQNYIIHDLKRSLAFIHTKAFVGIKEVADFHMPQHSQNEEKFQRLWKHFFDSVAIESRSNEKVQKSMVPLIYRTYMNEFWSV